MANSLIQASGGAAISGSPRYHSLAGDMNNATTETNVQVMMRSPGVASKMFVQVTINTSSTITVTSRKNAAAGAQTVTVTNSTIGIFEDTTHTDTISAGEKWNYNTTVGGIVTLTINIIQMTFAATTNTVTKLVAANAGGFAYSVSTTSFTPLQSSFTQQGGTEANMKTRVEKAGTFKNIYVNIITPTATTTQTAILRDNGADSAIVATTTANTSGFFEDTTHTLAVTVGHDYNDSFTVGTVSASLVVGGIGIEFESTDGTSLISAGAQGLAAFLKTTTNYNAVGGKLVVGTTTESFAQSYVRDATFTISNLGVFIAANGSTLTNSVTLRKNAVDTTLLVSFTTATGLLEDTTHIITGL